MSITVHVKTVVLPGNRIEVTAPELPQGRPASVLIVVDEEVETPRRPLSEVLASVPAQRSFKSAEEVDAYLQAERDAWDR